MSGGRALRLRGLVVAACAVACLVFVQAPGAGAQSASPRLEQRREEPQTSVEEVAPTVMCPSCGTTIDQSTSPAAERVRAYVRAGVDAGWTAEEIRDGLVEEYGGDESVLAAPRARGLGLVAWLVPAGVVLVAVGVGIGALRRWRRQSSSTDAESTSSS